MMYHSFLGRLSLNLFVLMMALGNKVDFNERYNSFFIDYSLLPLLVQQNYIDSSQAGISRMPGKDAADKLDLLSKAADSVSEMELLGAQVLRFE